MCALAAGWLTRPRAFAATFYHLVLCNAEVTVDPEPLLHIMDCSLNSGNILLCPPAYPARFWVPPGIQPESEIPLDRTLQPMIFICEYCKKTVDRDEPCVLIVSGKGMYFFCSARCRDRNNRLTGKDRRSGKDRRCLVHHKYSGNDRRKETNRRGGKERSIF